MSLGSYLFEANLYLILFYVFYKILLDKETYFVLNRVYLIFTVILSFGIPFCSFDWLRSQSMNEKVQLNLVRVIAKATDVSACELGWERILMPLYFTGVVIASVLLVYRLHRIRKMIVNPDRGVAFSFFKIKVIDENLPHFQLINKHEEIHIKQMHSIDIMLIEIAGLVIWFNPVIYFYKRNIKNVHEYLADREAAGYHGSKKEYALILFNKSMGTMPYLVNPFLKQSMLKNRILMLQKARSKRRALFKYGLIVPLLTGLLLLTSMMKATVHLYQDDLLPVFPGAYARLVQHIKKSIKYPVQEKSRGIQGQVILGFVVDPNGIVTGVEVVKGVSPALDKEAVRIVESSPRWKRAKPDSGKPWVRYNMGITFKI